MKLWLVSIMTRSSDTTMGHWARVSAYETKEEAIGEIVTRKLNEGVNILDACAIDVTDYLIELMKEFKV